MLQKRHIVLLIVCLLAACRNITNQDAVAEIEVVPTETAVLAATIEPTTETADPTVEPTIVPTQIPDPTSAPTITPDPIPDPTATNRLILQGEYLGQDPPGNTPILFAPGFVSTEDGFEFSVTFSPDGTEFYFTRREPNGGNLIYFTELVDGQWKTPTPASFNADYVGAEAIMSPDGMRMFFFARRPLPEDANPNAQTHYWTTERTETGWSEPEYLAPDMMYVSAANNGTLYFTVANENSPFFLAKMSPTANGYAEPEHLDIPALGSQGIAHPFISPDESYMIFNSIPTETGSLYVVFRQEDDSWSDPIGLGDEINTDQEEFAPLVSPDGNYLFFAREGDIYWVSTEVIEEQRPEELSETGDSNTELSNQLPLQGKYLGQSPPGVTPQIFAPGFVSTDDSYEGSSTFSPDGTEFYFTRIMPDGGYYVLVTKLEDGQWTSPEKASFNPDIVFDGTEAMITPDGSKLFFFSKRPLSGESGNDGQPNMWVTEREENGWSEPEFFGSDMMYITQANNGTIYFTDISGRNRTIFSSQLLTDGTYAQPQEVEIPAQDYRYYGHPFIAPDESYLIFNTIPPDDNDMDLFIVFKMDDESWSEPQNMGEPINTDANEFLSMVTPDGDYFFFTREDNESEDIYWVSAEAIEERRPEELSETGDSNSESAETMIRQGEYLGQTPPGDVPEIFAPGFVSTEDGSEYSSTFSPGSTEFYFTQVGTNEEHFVFVTRLEDGQWTTPALAPFNGDSGFGGSEALITPDGETLFFMSKRPLPGETESYERPNMWMTERDANGWMAPEPFGSDMMYVTQATNETIYFTDISRNTRYFIASQTLSGGEYADSQEVIIPELGPGSYGHPFIAPDESYLIFNSIPRNDNMDLFIVFKMVDGSWTEPQNLGESINTDGVEFAGMVTPDGEYFFFTRSNAAKGEPADIYWVSSSFIDDLRLQAGN